MAKLLGAEAYRAARTQTRQRLSPMKEALIRVAKEHYAKTARKETVSRTGNETQEKNSPENSADKN